LPTGPLSLQLTNWTTSLKRWIHTRRDSSSSVQICLICHKIMPITRLLRRIRHLMWTTLTNISKSVITSILISFPTRSSLHPPELHRLWFLSTLPLMAFDPQISCIPLATGLTPI
jgi:hypothetical protein